jgi:hypothetical protein
MVNGGVPSAPSAAQRVHHLLVHRDAAPGAPYFAAIAVPSGDTAWAGFNDLDERAYAQASGKYTLRGYRLRRVNAFQTKAGMRYAAIWQLAQGPAWETRHGMTPAQFAAQSDRYAARGFAIAHVDAAATSSGTRFAAIWEKRDAAQKHFTALTGAAFKLKSAELATQGYRPRQVAGHTQNGRALFAATFEKGGAQDFIAHHAMAEPAFRARVNAMLARNYRLSDASGYVVRGRPMFSGIWERA